ncbi:SufD family Fe-S cluster assembly protein [Candidatus Karelsulcia muelleri]|uniref:Iron-sulfur cluster assembly protein SufD n=1 Tax=Candidatus Karelsulcia muelleri TaxID=336810 RepID=A0A346E128_9FLAO|nr:SufD family Fe-S cluster assembly protein [Candidatus Karelsulcia muelleri]AXN02683.1 Iron-sulfur cluster assembly protein SufD [Candidatus Karelsulcia muelleri]WDI79613.1 SufD family Fe-S cluster assembly protein [Candidatus Karelsulcia muelleri]WDR78935.1 SufD family Fe-S cluster assembly protein [Candidatus Karelsulcia muelleri]
MTLKEKIFLLLKKQKQNKNKYIESIIKKSIGFLHKIGFTELKKTCFNSVLNYDFDIPKTKNEVEDYRIKELSFNKKFISLYFINGFFSSKLSNLCKLKNNMKFSSLKNFLSTPQNKNIKYFCKTLFNKDNFFFNNTFIALNISLTPDGFFLKIPKNTNLNIPIEIINIYSTKISAIINLKNIIVVGKNSNVKIIERHISTSKKYIFSNLFTEIFSNDHSKIEIFKLENDLRKTYLIDNTFINQRDNSVCKVFTFSSNIRHIINNINCLKLGQDTKSFFNGLSFFNKSNNIRKLYNNVVIQYETSNSVSYQNYKGIFSKNSYGIFKSKIKINDNLYNINSKQTNSNLLLSNSSKVLSRQEFKTYSSKVKCEHGTNIGKLDKRSIFFFRTRGIVKTKAIKLAILIFANELIKLVNLNILKNKIIAYLKDNLKFDFIKI